jgi:hypothetical protein
MQVFSSAWRHENPRRVMCYVKAAMVGSVSSGLSGDDEICCFIYCFSIDGLVYPDEIL